LPPDDPTFVERAKRLFTAMAMNRRRALKRR
jgi:hypothetical protein